MISQPVLFLIGFLCVVIVVMIMREERAARRIQGLTKALSQSRSKLLTALGKPGAKPKP